MASSATDRSWADDACLAHPKRRRRQMLFTLTATALVCASTWASAWAAGGAGTPLSNIAPGGAAGTDGTLEEATGKAGQTTAAASAGPGGGGGAVDLTTGSGAAGGARGLGNAGPTLLGDPGATGGVGLQVTGATTIDHSIAGIGGAASSVVSNHTVGGGGGGGAGIHATADIAINGGVSVTGGNGFGTGNAGGSGGGGVGVFSTAVVVIDATAQVKGGAGGGSAALTASGGGGGGMGVLLRSGGTVVNSGTVLGGAGGRSSSLPGGGSGGDGGAGVQVVDGGTVVNLVGGSITGGAGGATRNAGTLSPGAGGAGVKGSGITLINAGHISGAFNGAPQNTVRANAVEFTGGVNSLEIRAGYAFDGNVVAFSAADALKLGGDDAASFDVTQIGAAAQYRGFGTYEKTGAGTWTLSGTTAAITPWTVSGGVLSISSDGNLGATSSAVTLNGGTLQNTAAIGSSRAIALGANGGTLQTDADFSASGVVSGAGVLTKSGAGTLTLTGRNTYTGGTNIVAGTLVGSAASFGSGAIANNAALIVDQPGDGVLANDIGGSGSLTKQGSGQLTLAGQNTYTGGTHVVAGTLIGSVSSFGSGTIVNDAALILDQPTDAVLANNVQGAGSLTKQGAGRLNLTGIVDLTGVTSVEGGTLAVNGSLTNSAVNVANGGTLGGNGTVGATTIRAGGIVAPGNSIGTLHVNGAFVQQAGSVYAVQVAPAAADLIDVDGSATVAPGAGMLIGKDGTGFYSVGTTYTVLTASGGVTGTYALGGNTALTPFLGLQDSYDANHVYLKVIQTKSLGDVATTPNQSATAGGAAGTPVETPLLNSPSDADARDTLDQLSGSALASTKGALIYDSRYTRELAIDRLRDAFCTVGHAAEDSESGRDSQAGGCVPNRDRFTAWAQTFGSWGHSNGNGNAAGMERSSAGFVTGIDAPVSAHWRVGGLIGYSHGNFDVDDQRARSDSDDYHLGIYGGAQWAGLVLRLGAAYTWHDISSDRTVAFGTTSQRLQADYDGGTAQTFGELGYQIQDHGVAFEPYANIAYVNLHTDGFTEDGGSAALHSRDGSTDTTFSTLGVRVSTDVNVGPALATLRGLLGWRRAYGDITPKSRVSFAGGSAFTVSGIPIAKDAAVVGAGMDLRITRSTTLGLSFEGQFGGGATDRAVRGTLAVAF